MQTQEDGLIGTGDKERREERRWHSKVVTGEVWVERLQMRVALACLTVVTAVGSRCRA